MRDDRPSAVCTTEVPKKDNAAARLDRELSTSRGIAEEITSATNKVRELLIGFPPAPPCAKDKNPVTLPGFLGHCTKFQSETNGILAGVLDDLRTVLSEIQ
jgi:hypothetical protein